MTEAEATDRLLRAIAAARNLMRHGFHDQAAAVLAEAEADVRAAVGQGGANA